MSSLRFAALLALLLLAPDSAVAKPHAKAAQATKTAAAAPAVPDSSHGANTPVSPAASTDAAASTMTAKIPGLPHYVPPAAYSEDLVIETSESKDITMRRSIDGSRMRTEMSVEGQKFTMIELGDEKGTSYILMPDDKRAIKQTREAMRGLVPQGAAPKAEAAAAPPDAKVEDLGETTIDGRAARKIRMTTEGGSALGFFDKETGAPLRMESDVEGDKTSMEWKNVKPGPQAASLFEIPKGYEVTDMDAMMAQMKSMGGMSGMSGLESMGMGAAKGMAGSMANQFGTQMGAGLGSTLGASLGGPLGAMAGQYLGGMLGGMLAKKTADVVIPGK